MCKKRIIKSVVVLTLLVTFFFCCYRYYVFLKDYSIYEISIDNSFVKHDGALVVVDTQIPSDESVIKVEDDTMTVSNLSRDISFKLITIDPSLHSFSYCYYDDLTPILIQGCYATCTYERIYIVIKNSNKEVIHFLKNCSFDGVKARKIK